MGRKRREKGANALFRHELTLHLRAEDVAQIEYIAGERAAAGHHLLTTTDVIRYALAVVAYAQASAAVFVPAEKKGGAK